MARFIVFVLIGVMVAVLVIASITVHRASAATIATDAVPPSPAPMEATSIASTSTIATTSPIATASTSISASTSPVATGYEAEAPREVMLGRFMVEPYMVRENGEAHGGGRFGADMIIAAGEGSTRLASGIRFLLGGDGAGRFGTEGQLEIGVAHTIRDRAVFALVAPLGFALGGGNSSFEPHGYAGIESVAAVGHFAREQGPGVRGVEIAAGIYTRGERARIGVVLPGRDIGLGIGVDWQREGDADLFGLYVASTPGR